MNFFILEIFHLGISFFGSSKISRNVSRFPVSFNRNPRYQSISLLDADTILPSLVVNQQRIFLSNAYGTVRVV